MRIELTRTGGLAAMRLTAIVDTAALPPGEAAEIEAMVRSAGFFDLPPALAAPARGADRFHYRLTVEDGARRHTVEAGEAAVPAALQPLLQRLVNLARRRPR